MTEKRFAQKDEDDWEILDRNKHFAFAHSGYQAEKIIQELNELVETNRELYKENKRLKQSSTMYYNLFKDLQRQMQGVKSMHDLDSRDFEDLIELSKGNVFDDKIGWVHLPIRELKE